MAEHTIRIGLLGASRIAPEAVIGPAAEIESLAVAGIAASTAAKAQDFAAEHDIPTVAADYAALVRSDAVDLVYNALPPSGHLEWTVAALRAGKHVLCEKPFAMNAVEAVRMVAAATETGCALLEAFHYRFHPLTARILEIVSSGSLGDIQELDARFCFPIPYRPGELRHEQALGGGSLMDLGCYPVHWVRTVMAAEPRVVAARAKTERDGVDVTMTADLVFPCGARARITCSMAAELPPELDASLTISGTNGRMAVTNPLAPHGGHSLALATAAGTSTEVIDGKSTYHHQLEHVLDVISGRAEPVTGGADAIANMTVIDEIYLAAGMQPRGAGT